MAKHLVLGQYHTTYHENLISFMYTECLHEEINFQYTTPIFFLLVNVIKKNGYKYI